MPQTMPFQNEGAPNFQRIFQSLVHNSTETKTRGVYWQQIVRRVRVGGEDTKTPISRTATFSRTIPTLGPLSSWPRRALDKVAFRLLENMGLEA